MTYCWVSDSLMSVKMSVRQLGIKSGTQDRNLGWRKNIYDRLFEGQYQITFLYITFIFSTFQRGRQKVMNASISQVNFLWRMSECVDIIPESRKERLVVISYLLRMYLSYSSQIFNEELSFCHFMYNWIIHLLFLSYLLVTNETEWLNNWLKHNNIVNWKPDIKMKWYWYYSVIPCCSYFICRSCGKMKWMN